ncbi:MAG: hypothetical protein A2460_00600 [Omnitrophica WOR_2 bacterium RIFOXYC2_FULL_43_9]|nr:MAG: hypothetical protein A2460_00600 [Omnitrophica WOR_2 bacterium RIFOXYC2_FULL_43_9]
MKKTAIYAVTLTVISLGAGAVIGVAVDHQLIKKRLQRLHHDKIAKFQQARQGGPKELFEKISSALRLDDKQKEVVKQIVEKTRNDIAEIGKEAHEKMLTVRNESNDRMREILNPQQQQQFQKMLSDLEEKGQKARRFLQRRLSPQPPAPGEAPEADEHLPPPPPPGAPEDFPEPPENF